MPVMPSTSLPIGGIVYPHQGYSPSANHLFFQHSPGPPPGSPATLHPLAADTDLIMVSLTELVKAHIFAQTLS